MDARMAEPRTAKQVIDQAIKENRWGEWLAMLKPKHSFRAVVNELVQGLRSGEMVLDNNSNAEGPNRVEGGPTDERIDQRPHSDDMEAS
jgi:hypothetical protein